jgi:hypothetical protein
MHINPVYISEQREEQRRLRFVWSATAAVCGIVVGYMLIYAAARDARNDEIQRRIDACKPPRHAILSDGVVLCRSIRHQDMLDAPPISGSSGGDSDSRGPQ